MAIWFGGLPISLKTPRKPSENPKMLKVERQIYVRTTLSIDLKHATASKSTPSGQTQRILRSGINCISLVYLESRIQVLSLKTIGRYWRLYLHPSISSRL